MKATVGRLNRLEDHFSRRVQRLEERRAPWQAENRPSPADVLREHYRRRMEESGEPYIPLPPSAEPIPGQTITEVLRSRFKACG